MGLTNYTDMYEYACDLVKKFIEREECFSKESIFESNSPLTVFFTSDYSTLNNSTVQKTITDQFERLKKDGGSGLGARLNGLIADLYSALGSEFMTQLRKNITEGLLCASGDSSSGRQKDVRKSIETCVNNYPIIMCFVIGSKIFQKKLYEAKIAKARSEDKIPLI